MPAHKKDPSVRARTNRASTAAVLSERRVKPQAPDLPAMDWHPMTLQWWQELWDSPMAAEYNRVDARGLVRLALLENDYWTADSARDRKDAATEIRLQQKDYGLTPYDRRRLEWTTETAEESKDRGRARRARQVPEPAAAPATDPRSALRAV